MFSPKAVQEEITLVTEDGQQIKALKAVLALASPVFRDVLEVEPGCSSIQVDGTPEVWAEVLSCLHPGMVHKRNWSSNLVAAMLPLAHKYGLQAVLAACADQVSNFEYNMEIGDSMNALKWLEYAEQYKVEGLADGAVAFIVDVMKRSKEPTAYRYEQEFAGKFLWPNNITGPATVLKMLKIFYRRLLAR